MADPFLGQIKMFGGTFAPRGWAFCDGQLLPIAQNTAVFSLVGTTYGGDGRTTFALPELRGRILDELSERGGGPLETTGGPVPARAVRVELADLGRVGVLGNHGQEIVRVGRGLRFTGFEDLDAAPLLDDEEAVGLFRVQRHVGASQLQQRENTHNVFG